MTPEPTSDETGSVHEHCARRARLVLGLAFALTSGGLAVPHEARATPLRLDGSFDERALLPHMSARVDPAGTLTIDEVAAAPLAPISEMHGGEGDIVWLAAAIEIPAHGARPGDDWYLVLAHPYAPGALYVEADGGFVVTPVRLDPKGAPFMVALPRTPGVHRVFLRVPFPLMLPSLMHVATLSGHHVIEQRMLTAQGIYLGVILAILLVNFLMGLGLRDRTHLWYVAFVGASAIYFAIQTGTVSRFLLPTVPAGDLFRPGFSFLALMIVAGVQFSRRFLDTSQNLPRLDRVMRIYLGLAALALAPTWFGPAPLVLLTLAILGALLPFVVLAAGVASWRAGVRAARFYLLGWSLFALSGFVFAVPLPLPTGMSGVIFQLGSALEAAVLSLALVDRMRLLREERALMAAARDRAELEAARSEKLASLGQLVAGVAHEVNNPNNFLTFNLPILEDYLEAVRPHVEAAADKDPDLRLFGLSVPEFFADAGALIGHMQHGTQRIAGIVSQLRTYARVDDAAKWEEADVNGVVRDAVTLVGNQLHEMVGRFDVDLGDGLGRVRMNPGRIEQVVINLLVNAGHAAQPIADSRVGVTTRRDDGHVVVIVEDNGPGVPADIRARVFEPFFTTKPREQGTGMGLAISKRIVDEHGGTLTLESEPGQPTRFIVRLPVAPPSSPPKDEPT